MAAYLAESNKQYPNLVELYNAAGKRLIELGDVSHGMEFILLAEQKKAAEDMTRVKDELTELVTKAGNITGTFEEENGKYARALDSMSDLMTQFAIRNGALAESSDSLRSSAVNLQHFGTEIGSTVSRMEDAAQSMANTARSLGN